MNKLYIKKIKQGLNKLLVVVSTNLLALAIIGVFDAILFAAYWYWNIDFGKLPYFVGVLFLIATNIWVIRRLRAQS
ncbi:MAG: hypothetical protein AB1757_14045 [Acidobacteriota bacterium]